MAAFTIIVTDAGRAAIVNAEHNGTAPVTVAQVGITSTPFSASASTTALPNEIKRLATISGGMTQADTIHVTIRDDSADTYAMTGLGLYLQDGTLLAVYSQADEIMEKSSQSTLLLAADVQFVDINASSIAFGDTNFQLNEATEQRLGLVQLATQDEVNAGTEASHAVTPAHLKPALDKKLDKGTRITLGGVATGGVTLDGNSNVSLSVTIYNIGQRNIPYEQNYDCNTLLAVGDAKFINIAQAVNKPPTTVNFHLSQFGRGDINGRGAQMAIDANGQGYLRALWDQWTPWRTILDNTNVNRFRYAPGQIVVTAGRQPLPGTLLCNNQAVSRAQYADLFAVIGTSYGAGDGSTTFNVPGIGEDNVVKHTSHPDRVSQYHAGVVISHSHGASSDAQGQHGHNAWTSSAGSHQHKTWTDQQGGHSHGGGTANNGNHSHAVDGQLFGTEETDKGYAHGPYSFNPSPRRTDTQGDHNHSISWDGQHGHDISMDPAGDHTHNVGIDASGLHTHNITIQGQGGPENLPSGLRMMYCIAY